MFLSNAKFVFDYSPPVEYTRLKTPMEYHFTIREETHLGEHHIKNTYTIALSLLFDDKGHNYFCFVLKTSNPEFKLARELTPQGKLLEALAKLTQEVKVKVDEAGSIESFEYEKRLKKWNGLKIQLLRNHKGQLVENYLNGIDKSVKNESLFLERLKDPRFYGLLFDGLQTLNQESAVRKRKVSRLIHHFPVLFNEKIVHVEDKDSLRSFVLEGKMQDFTQNIKNQIPPTSIILG